MTSGESWRAASATSAARMRGWQVSNIRTVWPARRRTGASVWMPSGGKAMARTRASGPASPSAGGRRWK
jgi:hypothetical protein